MKSVLRGFWFVLEYLGIVEVVFQIKSSNILVGVFLNYLFGTKVLRLISGQLVDRNRMEFSIQRFIEKNVDIPVYIAKLILPSEFFVNRVITVPVTAKNKLENIVIASIESMGVFDVSSISYSYRVVGRYRVKDRLFLKVLVSAIKLSLLLEYVGYFRNLGIILRDVVSATVGNVSLFVGSSSVGAVAVILNKQDEIFATIVSGKEILKLDVIEISDKSVLENYIVSFISEFVKERSLFLEKILMFYFDPSFVERIFDRVNIMTISGEILPEYGWLSENFLYIDVISCIRGERYSINVLVGKDRTNVILDTVLFRLSSILTVLTVIGLVFVLFTRGEVERYSVIKRSVETGEVTVSPEVERYVKVIEVKKKMEEYENLISSFYSKFAGKERYFYVLYDIFKSLDRGVWLRDVEVLPKGLKVKGFAESDTSFYNTLKNMSKVERFSNVRVNSVYETSFGDGKVYGFEVEIGL